MLGCQKNISTLKIPTESRVYIVTIAKARVAVEQMNL